MLGQIIFSKNIGSTSVSASILINLYWLQESSSTAPNSLQIDKILKFQKSVLFKKMCRDVALQRLRMIRCTHYQLWLFSHSALVVVQRLHKYRFTLRITKKHHKQRFRVIARNLET